MNRSDLTDADMAATPWPDLFEGMTGSSNTLAPLGVHEDSIPEYRFTCDTGIPNFNAGKDTMFTPTPTGTTSMGTFTTQAKCSYPVSKQ
jgi:hypothetical protein